MKRKLHLSIKAISDTEALVKIIGYISEWRNSSSDFEHQVNQLIADGVTNVKLYINSGGGSVFEANEIVNIIKKFPGDFTVELGALCASAATIVMLPAKTIKMASNGQVMIHRPMLWVEGNEDELKSSLKLLQTLQNNFLENYSKKTGLSKDEISALWQNDYWMDAKEAKAKGFVDEIIGEAEAVNLQDVKALIGNSHYKNIPEKLVAMVTNTNLDSNSNLDTPPDPTNKNQIEINNMREIAILLGLKADANIVEIQAAIQKLQQSSVAADALKTELDGLRTEAKTKEVDAFIDNAIEKKKILPTQRAHFTKLAMKEFETTKAVVNGMSSSIVVTDILDEVNTDGKPKAYEDYTPAELAKMADETPDAYAKLIDKHFKN